jgi:hypothetical protein
MTETSPGSAPQTAAPALLSSCAAAVGMRRRGRRPGQHRWSALRQTARGAAVRWRPAAMAAGERGGPQAVRQGGRTTHNGLACGLCATCCARTVCTQPDSSWCSRAMASCSHAGGERRSGGGRGQTTGPKTRSVTHTCTMVSNMGCLLSMSCKECVLSV